MVEKIGKKCFHYNIEELFERISRAVTDGNQKIHERTDSNTKAIEELDESNVHINVLKLMYENGIIHSSLIGPIAELLVPTNKSQFWIYNDLIAIIGMIRYWRKKTLQCTMIS